MSCAMGIVGDIVSPRERGRYQGYIVGTFALASVVGPLVGGTLTSSLSWRWCFYVNVPVGLVALVVTSVVLHLPRTSVNAVLDYLGALLMVVSVTALLMVTVWGGSTYSWTSVEVLAAMGVAVVFGVLFVCQEFRAPEPLLPIHVFSSSIFRMTSAANGIVGLVSLGLTYFVPLYLQLVTGTNPTTSGLLLIPMMAGTTTASMVAGRLVSRTGRYKAWPIAGAAFTICGVVMLIAVGAHTGRGFTESAILLCGLGIGSIMPVQTIAVQNSVDRRYLGTVTSGNIFFRSLGSALGVASFGSIFNQRLVSNLAHHGASRTLGKFSASTVAINPEQLHHLPAATEAQFVASFAFALHGVFLAALPVVLLLVPCTLA